MRALVTGSAGFVGRHMTMALFARGFDVDEWDIADGNDCLDLFRLGQQQYDLVVHAAARSPHRAAIDGEPAIHPYNQLLDAALFEWAIRTRQGRVLYLSSSAAYPIRLQTAEWYAGQGPTALAEHMINLTQWGKTGDWSPDAMYGWTKLTGEHLAGAARAAGLAVTIVRPFSGYGTDQADLFPFRAIIERARRRADPFEIWGSGWQTRDWIHIDDVVAGALAVVDSGTTETVNLCTGIGTTMVGLAQLACAAIGYEPTFEFLTDRPAGVVYRVGDPDRFHRYYRPTVTLADGVQRALEMTG